MEHRRLAALAFVPEAEVVRVFEEFLDTFFKIYTIHMYSGITSGRVLNGELLYTKS